MWVISHCFLRPLEGVGSEMGHLGLEQVLIWDANAAGGSLTHYAAAMVSHDFIYMKCH